MIRPFAFAGLFCASLAMAADAEKLWPQKGDVVYVAGDLNGVFGAPPLVQHNSVTVPACSPMRVAFKPKPASLYVADDGRGAAFKLCEGWSSVIHATAKACSDARTTKPIALMKKGGCYAVAEAPDPQ